MADRYWVGGTASWDGTAGTKWATTSGGAGGASVPTSADDVFFDAASGTVTVTVAAIVNCRDLNFTGFTGTLAGSSSIQASNNVTVASGMGWTHTGSLTFLGGVTQTFTTNGKSITSNVITDGSSTALSLADALITTGSITVTRGTFTTNNYAVTASSLSSSNSNTRTINLGSSTVTLSAAGGAVNFTSSTNLTFNAGSSSIVFTNTSAVCAGGGVTFYDVSWTTSPTSPSITGANTFNNLSIAGRTSAGIAQVSMGAEQTINGTLTLSAGGNATMRTFVRSNTIGETRTLTCAAVASLTDIDFRDITIAGAAAPVSGTRLGDCKGNSGITFDAAKTVYCIATGTLSANWNSTLNIWDTSPTGAGTVNAFPLAQDTAVFQTTRPGTGSTIIINAAYNIGTIDMSARTSNTMTLATSTNTPTIYGDWINGTGVTLTGTGTMTFAGRGSQTITSAGKTFTQLLSVDTPGGSVTLQDALTCNRNTVNALQLESGTLDANDYNITLSNATSGFSSDTSNTRTFDLGSATLTIAGAGNIFDVDPSTNFTFLGTGVISLTSTSGKAFYGGGFQNYPTLNQGGTGTLIILGSNKFANITNTAIGRIQFTGGTTNEFTSFSINGTSGNLLQLGSTNTTQAILKRPSDWNVGANSTDAGNNTGLSFVAGSNDYLSISYINGQLSVAPFISASVAEASTASETVYPVSTYNITVPETSVASDSAAALLDCLAALAEAATAADVVEAVKAYLASVAEAVGGSDAATAALALQASLAEMATATDALAVSNVLAAISSESATVTDSTFGGLFFDALVTEGMSAQDAAEAIRALDAAIAEALQAVDTPAVVASTFKAAAADTAQAVAQESTQAVFNAYVDYLPQPMAVLPTGTSAAGSLIFDSASFTGGAAVYPNGAGTGTSGGFNLGGNYLGFPADNTVPYPIAQTTILNLTNASHVSVTLIAGNDSNGGGAYAADFRVVVYYFNGVSYSFQTIATITPAAARPSAITVVAPIPAIARNSNAFVSFFAYGTATPPFFPPLAWGVSNIELYFGGASAAELVRRTYTANPTIIEAASSQETTAAKAVFGAASADTASMADTAQVAPSVFTAVAAAVAVATDPLSAPSGVYNATLPVESAGLSDQVRRAKLRAVNSTQYDSVGALVLALTGPTGVAYGQIQVEVLTDTTSAQVDGANTINAVVLTGTTSIGE